MIPKHVGYGASLLLLSGLAFGGPNAAAVLAVDLAPATASIDTTGAVSSDSAFWIAIRISNAQGLATYGFDIGYDTAALTFLQALPDSAPADLANFLTSRGGASAGFVGQMMRDNPAQISIANALTGQDSTQAPSGDGLLALIQFRPKSTGLTRFTLSAIQLLDWRQQLDTASMGTGAGMTVQSSALAVWSPRSVFFPRRIGGASLYEIAALRNVLGRMVAAH